VTQPIARIEEAKAAKLEVVKGLFESAHVAFPPAELLLRAFKSERRFELWAASRPGAALEHVTTYEICSASGKLGPKRARGDWQVPEGFYSIKELSPSTPFYLAMEVSYPNLSDRALGKKDPGDQIMIHGKCVSAGCLAMADERIQEIWVATSATYYRAGRVDVHIFPSRDMEGVLASSEYPEHHAFWENLKEGFDAFEKTKRLPLIRIDTAGRYHFR
jgi:murein L,D-transpeptidase YafK